MAYNPQEREGDMHEKECYRCKNKKTFSCFHRDKRSPDGRRSVCRECRKPEYSKPLDVVESWNKRRKERMSEIGKSTAGKKRSEEFKIKIAEAKAKQFKNYDYEPACIRRVQNRYKKFGLNMNFEDFKKLIKSKCHYCGCDPIEKDYPTYSKINNNTIFACQGIDRVDNDKGYELSNCVPCCRICNIAKHTMSLSEFLRWIKCVYQHNYTLVT